MIETISSNNKICAALIISKMWICKPTWAELGRILLFAAWLGGTVLCLGAILDMKVEGVLTGGLSLGMVG